MKVLFVFERKNVFKSKCPIEIPRLTISKETDGLSSKDRCNLAR
jgi:hypothetical protein